MQSCLDKKNGEGKIRTRIEEIVLLIKFYL